MDVKRRFYSKDFDKEYNTLNVDDVRKLLTQSMKVEIRKMIELELNKQISDKLNGE